MFHEKTYAWKMSLSLTCFLSENISELMEDRTGKHINGKLIITDRRKPKGENIWVSFQ